VPLCSAVFLSYLLQPLVAALVATPRSWSRQCCCCLRAARYANCKLGGGRKPKSEDDNEAERSPLLLDDAAPGDPGLSMKGGGGGGGGGGTPPGADKGGSTPSSLPSPAQVAVAVAEDVEAAGRRCCSRREVSWLDVQLVPRWLAVFLAIVIAVWVVISVGTMCYDAVLDLEAHYDKYAAEATRITKSLNRMMAKVRRRVLVLLLLLLLTTAATATETHELASPLRCTTRWRKTSCRSSCSRPGP
jgi:hypothetical protein